ncbi:MAG: phage morphogenesis protein [Bacteroides sp.]|nr:phage morphogenesis protein [Bacteroides sp.]
MEGEKVIKDLEKLVKQYIDLTISDIRVEATEMFDKNFQREAFFNEKWARRKFNDDDTRNILTGTGALRKSIISKVEGNKIVFETTLPYASIHNEGGTITVTKGMKQHFWKMYLQIVGSKKPKNGQKPFNERFQRNKKGNLRNNKKNRTLTAAAEFYRAMALKPIGSKIVIPKRQFIGNHPELEAAIFEIAGKNAIKIFKDV